MEINSAVHLNIFHHFVFIGAHFADGADVHIRRVAVADPRSKEGVSHHDVRVKIEGIALQSSVDSAEHPAVGGANASEANGVFLVDNAADLGGIGRHLGDVADDSFRRSVVALSHGGDDCIAGGNPRLGSLINGKAVEIHARGLGRHPRVHGTQFSIVSNGIGVGQKGGAINDVFQIFVFSFQFRQLFFHALVLGT